MSDKGTFYFKLYNNRNQKNEILYIYPHLLAFINFFVVILSVGNIVLDMYNYLQIK